MKTGSPKTRKSAQCPTTLPTVAEATCPPAVAHTPPAPPRGPHLPYHNAYGRLMVEGTRDAFMEIYPDRRPFVLTRANLLGGHRYAATWTGDTWAGCVRSAFQRS